MVGVKRHGANRGCRTCNATKDSLTSNKLDLQLISRYHHQSNKQFKEISEALTITERKAIATEYGLQLNPPLLNQLKRERHLQSPQDVYHITAGKVLRFLKITLEAFSPEGKSELIEVWKSFEYPKTWKKLPNPISHIDSFMMSDCLQLTMMLPFILNRFLKNNHFKNSDFELFKRQTGVTRNDFAVKLWLKCWIMVAKTTAIVFKDSFTEDEYGELRDCLHNERMLLSQDDADEVFSPDEKISHISLKRRVLQRNIDASLLLNIQVELNLAYEDFGDNSAIIGGTPSYFEYASFLFEKEKDDFVLCRLHIRDVVSINIEDGNNYAIIRAIFCHQKNDLRFAFVIVDWFEELNRTRLEQFHFIHDLEHVQLDLE
ncbi:unnamed protein product [Rhizophagus irregularis]|nr:unnamed protein product [Rhizophagus irregularis]